MYICPQVEQDTDSPVEWMGVNTTSTGKDVSKILGSIKCGICQRDILDADKVKIIKDKVSHVECPRMTQALKVLENAGPTDPGAGNRLRQILKARPAAAETTVSAARKVLKRPAAAKAPKAVTTSPSTPAAPAIAASSSGNILGCSKCRWGKMGLRPHGCAQCQKWATSGKHGYKMNTEGHVYRES